MSTDKAVVLIVTGAFITIIASTFSDAFKDPISQQIEKCKYACKDMASYDAEKKVCTCRENK